MKQEDINTRIDELLLDGPVMDILHYEESRNTYELIANNAEAIRASGYEDFFGHIQSTLLKNMILHVCRMFEKDKRHEMRTFPEIISILSNKSDVVVVAHSQSVHDEWRQSCIPSMRGKEMKQGGCLISAPLSPYPELVPNEQKTNEFVNEFRLSMPNAKKNPKDELSAYYERLTIMRSKEIAHNEAIDASAIDRPTFDMLEELVWWAKVAIDQIRRTFLPAQITFYPDGEYQHSRRAKHSCYSLQRMLQELGVSLLERDSEAYVKIFKERIS